MSEVRAGAFPLLPPSHLVLGGYLAHHVAGLASPVASEALELSPGMAPHWGTTECTMRIIHLRTLSSQSLYRSSALISIPCRGLHYRLRRARASRSRRVLAPRVPGALRLNAVPALSAPVLISTHNFVLCVQHPPVRWLISGMYGGSPLPPDQHTLFYGEVFFNAIWGSRSLNRH